MRYEIDIFHYIDIYKRHLKRMVFLIIIAMLVTLMIQSMQPTTYRSTLTAISSRGASQQARGIGKILGLSMNVSSDEIIFSMLKSRRMKTDINRHFGQKLKPKVWWRLDTYEVQGGFIIEVTGSNPELTRDIANFAAKNVDEINKELAISTELGMVKVLDHALKGEPIKKDASKKTVASGFFVFSIYTLFIFFREYFSQLKRSKGQ